MREIGQRLLMVLMNSFTDPLEEMIERAPHTITEADGTIIKHPNFVTDNKMLFDKVAGWT